MAFQIAYVFEAIDKFSKVAEKIEKRLAKIEKLITGMSQEFQTFQTAAVNSMNAVSVQTTRVRRGLDKINRGQIKNINTFKRFNKDAVQATRKIENSTDALNKSIRRNTKSMEVFRKEGAKSFKSVEAQTNRARIATERLESKQAKTNRRFRFFGNIASNLKFRLASLFITMGIAGFGIATAARKSMEFRDVLFELQALTGASGKNLDVLTRKAFEFGRQFGISGKDALTGMKQTADAFPELLRNIPGLIRMTKEALTLSTAAGMTVPNSVKALNAVLNIFSKDAGQARDVINQLAAGALLSNVMTEQLTQTIIRGGGAAKALGVSLPRVIALTNALGGSEIKAGKAGTAMNMMMIKMGMAQIKLGDESRKLSSIIGDIKEKYEQAGDAGLQYLAGLVGARHVKAVQAWLANIDKLDAWEKGVQGTNEAYRQAEIRMQGLTKASGKLGAAIMEKIQAVYDQLEPTLVSVADKMRGFFESITPEEVAVISAAFWGLLRTFVLIGEGVNLFIITPIRGLLWLLGKVELGFRKLDNWVFGDVPGEIKMEKNLISDMSPAQKSRMSVDINLKGNTDAVAGVQAQGEQNMDINFDLGANMAFIG